MFLFFVYFVFFFVFFFFNDTATTEIYTLSLHDALPICPNCDLPLVSQGREGPLVCTRCGYTEEPGPCVECGSSRMRQTGLGVERVRDELSEVLGVRVGLITAEGQD